MQKLGLDVEIILSRDDERSMNLASRIAGQDSNRYRSLVLNAHADIVPVDAPNFGRILPLPLMSSKTVSMAAAAKTTRRGSQPYCWRSRSFVTWV